MNQNLNVLGIFSYKREDYKRPIENLHLQVQNEARAHVIPGVNFDLILDEHIESGRDWALNLATKISQSLSFCWLQTPRWFESEVCNCELEAFESHFAFMAGRLHKSTRELIQYGIVPIVYRNGCDVVSKRPTAALYYDALQRKRSMLLIRSAEDIELVARGAGSDIGANLQEVLKKIGGVDRARELLANRQGFIDEWSDKLFKAANPAALRHLPVQPQEGSGRSPSAAATGAAATSLKPAFDAFLNLIAEQSALRKAAPQEPANSVRVDIPVRVPNFLLFKRGRAYLMAICDHESAIQEENLRKTNEPQADTHLATTSDLETLGFGLNQVHPMVVDPANRITRIYVDASLYAQSLYFPNSKIQLPLYHQGPNKTCEVEIADFIAALSKHHAQKVVFANICRGKWKDQILLDGLRKINCFTRFAPTPSNSLHLGNVRTALIAYLLYKAAVRQNLFFLRFDDTDHTKTKELMVTQIQDELNWLGFRIEKNRVFRQSAPDRQALYDAAMLLLRHCSYIRRNDEDEGEWLDYSHPDLKFGCWMDLRKGPIIIHHAPRATRDPKKYEGPEVVASLALGKTKRDREWGLSAYEYKFCGALDDLLGSSHIVRDQTQSITLTPRQAFIRHAIQQAWLKSVNSPVTAEALRHLEHAKEVLVEGYERPIPFFAPSIYYHVPLLMEVIGGRPKKMSKSNYGTGSDLQGNPAFIIEGIRNRPCLPETVISYLLATIIPTDKGVSEHRNYFAQMAAQLGATATINIVASDVSVDRLVVNAPNIVVSEDDLIRQEKRVISKMLYYQFVLRLEEYATGHGKGLAEPVVLERLFEFRNECASWKEIVQIATHRRPKLESDLVLRTFIEKLREMRRSTGELHGRDFPKYFSAIWGRPRGSSFKQHCGVIRFKLMGVPVGINPRHTSGMGVPLYILGHIVEPEFA